MTPTEYWDGDNELPRAFLKADRLKRIRKNNDDYRLGAYFYSALMSVAPFVKFSTKPMKAEPYLKEPFPIDEREKMEREEAEAERREEAFWNRLKAEYTAQKEKQDG